MATKEHQAEIALELHAQLGEGPVWDERRQQLFFVDIMGRRAHAYKPSTGEHSSFDVGRPVGCVALCQDGGLVMAAHDAFFLSNADGSELRRIGDVEIDGAAVRFNDGKVCPRGRFLAGTMDWGKEQPLGSLYMLNGDGKVSVLLDQVTISNGLAWTEDGRTLYYIDTPQHQVDAFDFEPETGTISNRRKVAEFPGTSPDGMAIDNEGCLWVACWGGWRVERIDPLNGQRLEVIRVPTSHVSSVAFGGPNFDEMYITTAREDLSEEELATDVHAGNLFVAHTGASGPPACRFNMEVLAA